MTAKFAISLQKELEKIYQKDKQLSARIEKQIALFEENPKHPSLRLHKVSSAMDNTWSISITMSIRMVYILLDERTAVFTNIGTHDEVYKK